MKTGIEQLLGKTLTAVVKNEANDEIIFTVNDGTEYKMYHRQDCCEGVSIDDINGDLNDLVSSPILVGIAAVISSVCSCDNVHGEIETKTNYCWYCLKQIKEQTDL